jgi:folate-binding protein YgfZ
MRPAIERTMTAEDTIRTAYDAVRGGAAWIDRRSEGRLEVSGADRVSWLQGLLTNDVSNLADGQGCYAAYLTPQGRMITDLRVLARASSFWLDVPGFVKDAVLARLDMFVISEDVALRDLGPGVSRIAVYGPQAARTIAEIFVSPVPSRHECHVRLGVLAEHEHVGHAWRQAEVVVACTRDLGVTGFDVYAPATTHDDLMAALASAGALPLDEPTWDLCRLEAGRPRFGVDMDQDTIPLEAGLEDRAISFTKGCYVGQEVIVRVRDRGHGRVARRLMRLSGPAGVRDAFAAGDTLLAGDQEAGRVTSAAFSPSRDLTIGLGYVHRDHATAGVRLLVRTANLPVEVELA